MGGGGGGGGEDDKSGASTTTELIPLGTLVYKSSSQSAPGRPRDDIPDEGPFGVPSAEALHKTPVGHKCPSAAIKNRAACAEVD